ncbi:hypothetical protein F2P56_034785 [Juglans regia]|uniref:Cysteine-rich receptor-like protein kinase 35 n=2 Tax=Juglans regia TaxID=51240 RepID=A0A833TSE0_JUGRE|nr:uncharacterized protein LOC109000641 [Juglans regia]KAF5445759.1 hypothetical protein F2P56_034785 [Juglans regia]
MKSINIVLYLSIYLSLHLRCSDAQTWIKAGYWYAGSESPIPDINSALFTHLICAFANVDSSTYQLSIPSADEQYFANFTDIVKRRNPSVVTLLSIWNGQVATAQSILGDKVNTSVLSSMLSQSSHRISFIQSSIKTARQYGFQGIDLFWLWPNTASDMTNMGVMLDEWRADVNSESRNTSQAQLILTMALRYLPAFEFGSYPFDSIQKNMDWAHIVAYDYHLPSKENFTHAHAALYDPSSHVNTDNGIRQWLAEGFPANKLLLGLPYHGYAWTLVNPKENAVGAPSSGLAVTPDGSMSYKYIKWYIRSYRATSIFNATYVVNYCIIGSTWINFDDVEAIRAKIAYAKEKKLLGYNVFQVINDDNWVLSRAVFPHVAFFATMVTLHVTLLLVPATAGPSTWLRLSSVSASTSPSIITLRHFSTFGDKDMRLIHTHLFSSSLLIEQDIINNRHVTHRRLSSKQLLYNDYLLEQGLQQTQDEENGHGNKQKLLLIILLPIALIIILVVFMMCCVQGRVLKLKGIILFGKRGLSRPITNPPSAENLDSSVPHLQVFSFSMITAITNNFSSANKLGEGGFGPVYKGELPRGQEIAVKRLSKTSTQGHEEFTNEVTLTARLQHVNLVRLLGFCIENEEKMLIYEYMPNKSLDFYLFDPIKRHILDWRKRVHIIEGVTQGLLYLQEYSNFTIIHRDLKGSNILLDNDMNPKISDFGMAKLFGKDEHEANTGRIVGTYGYVPPEYVRKGVYSMKYDVYSFGVLLLQIISGKRNSCSYGPNESLSLLDYAYELWKEDKGMEFIDLLLDDSSSSFKLMRCLQVALLCVQENPVDRPTMLEVYSMLKNEVAPIPTPKKPAFSIKADEIVGSSSQSQQGSYSASSSQISQVVEEEPSQKSLTCASTGTHEISDEPKMKLGGPNYMQRFQPYGALKKVRKISEPTSRNDVKPPKTISTRVVPGMYDTSRKGGTPYKAWNGDIFVDECTEPQIVHPFADDRQCCDIAGHHEA